MFKLRYILYTGLLSLGLIVAFNLSLIPNFFFKTNDEQKFLELLDKEFTKSIEDNPIYASYMGDLRFNTLWPDYSIEKINTNHEHTLRVIEELEMMAVNDFSDENKLNYRLFLDVIKILLTNTNTKFIYCLLVIGAVFNCNMKQLNHCLFEIFNNIWIGFLALKNLMM